MRCLFILIWFIQLPVFAQNTEKDSVFIRQIYNEALEKGESYENLRSLCKDIGNRLTGSLGADEAVKWGYELLSSYNFDTVYLQEVMVPHWERGSKETAWLENHNGEKRKLNVLALGGSVSTDGPLKGEVLEVKNFEELKVLGREKVEGKIVFFNRAMDPKNVSTFRSYGGCYDQRGYGAVEAAKLGAIGVLVRSLSLKIDVFPHTGSMSYRDSVPKIPAAAISTRDAYFLKTAINEGKTHVSMQLNCVQHPDKKSYNVIAEMKGSSHSDEIILVGGHLDSWDVGEGAHDDGAGIAHSIEAFRILKTMNYRPKRTLRCVLYMNEENGNRGGQTYAKVAKDNKDNHLAAIESDRGGFAPRGFALDGKNEQVEKLQAFAKVLQPYNLHIFEAGYGGVDIGPLRDGKVALIGFVPDSQRYFDHHHAQTDVFESVNKRELEMGAASVCSLLYLIDQYGIN